MCVDRMYVFVHLCPPFYLNQPTDIHQTLYENCASVARPNALLVSFLQPIITTWQTREM